MRKKDSAPIAYMKISLEIIQIAFNRSSRSVVPTGSARPVRSLSLSWNIISASQGSLNLSHPHCTSGYNGEMSIHPFNRNRVI